MEVRCTKFKDEFKCTCTLANICNLQPQCNLILASQLFEIHFLKRIQPNRSKGFKIGDHIIGQVALRSQQMSGKVEYYRKNLGHEKANNICKHRI